MLTNMVRFLNSTLTYNMNSFNLKIPVSQTNELFYKHFNFSLIIVLKFILLTADPGCPHAQ